MSKHTNSSKLSHHNAVEEFKKNIGNPDRAIDELDHWYNCKNEIDDGASSEEHKIYKAIKELIKGVFTKSPQDD